MINPDLEKLIVTTRDELIPYLFGAGGMRSDFSPESLDELEGSINEMFPLGHKPLPTTYIPFGVYLGETIVQNIPNSKWDYSEVKDHVEDIAVVVGDDKNQMRLYPFRRVMNFWKDREDGLAVLFRTVQLMTAGGIDPTAIKQDEWIKFPNGDMIRVTTGKDDDADGKVFGSGHPFN
jgi:hypothetical protein